MLHKGSMATHKEMLSEMEVKISDLKNELNNKQL